MPYYRVVVVTETIKLENVQFLIGDRLAIVNRTMDGFVVVKSDRAAAEERPRFRVPLKLAKRLEKTSDVDEVALRADEPIVVPFSQQVLAELQAAQVDYSRRGMSDRAGTIDDHTRRLKDNLGKVHDEHAVHHVLDQERFGETFYVAAHRILAPAGRRIAVVEGDKGLSAAQRTFLESVYGLQLATFSTTRSGDKQALNTLNEEVLCPHFLKGYPAEQQASLRRLRGGMLAPVEARRAELERDLAHALRVGLVGARSGSTVDVTTNEKAIVRVRRRGDTDAYRDMTVDRLVQIRDQLVQKGIREIVLVGDRLPDRELSQVAKPPQRRAGGVVAQFRIFDLLRYFDADWFTRSFGQTSFASQLLVDDLLMRKFNAIGSVGMKSGALDAGSLVGVPQICFDGDDGELLTSRVGFTALCLVPWFHLPVSLTKGRSPGKFTQKEMEQFGATIGAWRRAKPWVLQATQEAT